MSVEQSASSPKVDMIQRSLGGPLGPGELGVLLARAGLGKTACLTHMALEYLLRGAPVLHVCIDEVPEKIKVWYHEFLRNISENRPGGDLSSLQQKIEPLRFILAYLHHAFSPEKLEQSLKNLEKEANFHPSVVILDGLDFDQISRSTLESLENFARSHGLPIWMSARTHRHISTANERGIPYPCNETDDMFHAILLLEPTAHGPIQVKVLKHIDGQRSADLPVTLNPQTFLLNLG